MKNSDRIELPEYTFINSEVSIADQNKIDRISDLYSQFDPDSNFQHACGLYSKGWISGGSNERRSHAKVYPYREALHAEQVALMSARTNVKNSTMYVCRVSTYDQSYRLSKPCFWCMHNIIAFGISKVVYTEDDSTLKSFKVSTVNIVSYRNTEIGSKYEVMI